MALRAGKLRRRPGAPVDEWETQALGTELGKQDPRPFLEL
ncbi:hypothetical protein VULLAG_LOCUS1577 [Vulpes lagopus]